MFARRGNHRRADGVDDAHAGEGEGGPDVVEQRRERIGIG